MSLEGSYSSFMDPFFRVLNRNLSPGFFGFALPTQRNKTAVGTFSSTVFILKAAAPWGFLPPCLQPFQSPRTVFYSPRKCSRVASAGMGRPLIQASIWFPYFKKFFSLIFKLFSKLLKINIDFSAREEKKKRVIRRSEQMNMLIKCTWLSRNRPPLVRLKRL